MDVATVTLPTVFWSPILKTWWVFLTKHRMCGINFDVIHSSLKMLELKKCFYQIPQSILRSLCVYVGQLSYNTKDKQHIRQRWSSLSSWYSIWQQRVVAGGQLQKFCLRWDLQQLAFIRKSWVYNKLYIWTILGPKTVLKLFSKWMQ